MTKHLHIIVVFCACFAGNTLQAQLLKSIIYDFDGFEAGSADLPEGDYSYGDLSYSVAVNSIGATDVTGDRVLKVELNWNDGYGAFGRGISRYLSLARNNDRFNFYICNPLSNNQPAIMEITIADDDNYSQDYEAAADDSWRTTYTVNPAAGWQLVSLPLSSFIDNNQGGNGVFDVSFDGGMLLLVELRFDKPAGANNNATFFLDMLNFSEGTMPQGSSVLSLPAKQTGDHCLLGAHQHEQPGEFYKIPDNFHALFPASATKKIKYVNTYLPWSNSGNTPNLLPGNGYQLLINAGYRPIITWEPFLAGYSMSDAIQPSYSKILNGSYDNYIDDMADQLKTYSDTVIVRLMHEFDGDWYPWCIANNAQNPIIYAQTFRYIVDRMRQQGATKVLWMWCPNSDIVPQAPWNDILKAYPGDSYVDIVATDVYNAHYPQDVPWWRSFRWQYTDVYYKFQKHFPGKPVFICELASRERLAVENPTSQTKAQWFAAMDRDLQSYFRKTRALIFFNENKSQSWEINTSPAALQSLTDNVWMDDYYFLPAPVALPEEKTDSQLSVYPVPAEDALTIKTARQDLKYLKIWNSSGLLVYAGELTELGKVELRFSGSGLFFAKLYAEDVSAAPIGFRFVRR